MYCKATEVCRSLLLFVKVIAVWGNKELYAKAAEEKKLQN